MAAPAAGLLGTKKFLSAGLCILLVGPHYSCHKALALYLQRGLGSKSLDLIQSLNLTVQ